MSINTRLFITGLALLAAGPAVAREPLSAIDWLSNSVTAPVVQPQPPVTAPGAVDPITVSPLGQPDVSAVGLLPTSVTGLPRDFWGDSDVGELARLVSAERVHTLPAIQRLLLKILLAELAPPKAEDGDHRLFLARLDKLLEMGALDQAQALLERAGPTDPAIFRRWFDVSLLTGHEDRACAAMRAAPGIAPTFPARIFCLARGGDWNAAALTLETGKALGRVSEEEFELLLRFLDPDYADQSPPVDSPTRPSPLVFRILDAIGQAMPTSNLPVAFAHADLRSNSGWKAQIEAAERLARSGALPPNQLLGIYTARSPAASGGVWDRVRAVQAFDLAMLGGQPDAIADTLPVAWAAMQKRQLEASFATLYSARLNARALPASVQPLAFRIGLLTDRYEHIAAEYEPQSADDEILIAIARGLEPTATSSDTATSMIAAAFRNPEIPARTATLLQENRLGEVVLHAIDQISSGIAGDFADVAEGLAILRHLGLEETARRAALELIILDRQE